MSLTVGKFRLMMRRLLAKAYYFSGKYKRDHFGNIVILMYHRVLEDDDKNISLMQPGMYVKKSTFEMQMEFLSRNYKIISMSNFLDRYSARAFDSSERYCVITFDDGWRDNYDVAFPILKKLSIPATIFLAEGYVGTEKCFWYEEIARLIAFVRDHNLYDQKQEFVNEPEVMISDLVYSRDFSIEKLNYVLEQCKRFSLNEINEAIKSLSFPMKDAGTQDRLMLNWDEVDEMAKYGISFGSHTSEHHILTTITSDIAQEEIEKSNERLSTRNINYIPVFCYPNGRFNDEIKAMVISAGYAAAVSTKMGIETPDGGLYSLKRIGLHEDISCSLSLFSYRLK